jgi:hypothetical protein
MSQRVTLQTAGKNTNEATIADTQPKQNMAASDYTKWKLQKTEINGRGEPLR